MGGLKFDGVVFDVDGVLFDTERLGRSVWREIGAEMGCPQAAENYLHFVGRSRADNLVEMARLFGPDFPGKDFMSNCSQRAMERMVRDGVPLKEGVHEILNLLKERNIPVALATSTYRDRTLLRMEMTGLGHYFQSMTTGDQVKQSKPHPEIYQMACRDLGVDPAHTLAVEDSRNGILSAHGAGMLPVMIPDLIPPTPELEALLFKRFASLLELRNYLAQTL